MLFGNLPIETKGISDTAKGFGGSWNITGICNRLYSFAPLDIYSVGYVHDNMWPSEGKGKTEQTTHC